MLMVKTGLEGNSRGWRLRRSDTAEVLVCLDATAEMWLCEDNAIEWA